jgi:very-short-patch-repair endonuclease
MTAARKLDRPLPAERLRKQYGAISRAQTETVDAWWPRVRAAVEVDSREWHLSPEDWEKTVRRHARMTAHGILGLHFTPKQIRPEHAQVVATIRAAFEAAFEAAQVDGQPPVRALPAAS